ncbi:MAG: FKBP-type peptidyl-prolyl cis-trans isomerase [Bacteroidales bacterium]|nr:FKBP-type peptidyl-prolyl cis-trans isomerase [Bacteroidales bacterium]
MKYIILILLLASVTGCQNKPDNRSSSESPSEERMIELNKSIITSDRQLITGYVSKSDLLFSETATGLWFSVLEKGGGARVKTGDNVTFDFECNLMDGNTLYSGTQTIRVGYEGTESGVTEGLQMMSQGSDYIFIIPPYLAYGHTGDGHRIPGRAILIYRIRVREVI